MKGSITFRGIYASESTFWLNKERLWLIECMEELDDEGLPALATRLMIAAVNAEIARRIPQGPHYSDNCQPDGYFNYKP